MRKITCYILILTLIIGIFSPLSFVNGQEAPMPVDPNTPESTISAPGDIRVVVTNPPQIQNDDSCGFICWGILMAINGILSQVMTFASLFLWLSGTLLDYILIYTIVNFSQNIEKMAGIQTAWVVIRDLMNLGFVFLLLYQGIRMILGRSNNAKQVIFGIVLASILINFSMFLTKVIIDASNVMTLGFYNAIVDTSHQEALQNNVAAVALNTAGSSLQTGISGAYVDSLGIHRFYDKGILTTIADTNAQKSIFIITIAATVIFVMVAVIFFAVAIMFLVRYVILIVLLMFSPLAVMGIAIPAVKSAQETWWKTLTGQAIFAPLYMVMTWVILTLINSEGFNPLATNGEGDWADLLIKGEISNIGLIINFIIIIVLTIMSLSISKKYATQGSTKIGEWTNKVTTFAGGAVMGGAAVAGRNTIGRGADYLSKNEKLKDYAAKGGISGFLAKNTIKTADRTATSSFDVRATKLGEQSKKTLGVDFGKVDPKKSNLRAIQEEKGKKEAKFAELLKPKEGLYDEARQKDKEAKEKLKASMNNVETTKNESDEKLKSLDKKIKDLKEELEKEQKTDFRDVSAEEEVRVRERINVLSKQIPKEEKALKELTETAKKNNEDYQKAKKAYDEYKSKEEDVIKDVYKERVNTYADFIEDESKMSLFSKALLLKIPTLGVIGGSSGHTPGDNKIIARKIRAVIKEKPKVTKKTLKDTFGVDLSDDTPEEDEGSGSTTEKNKAPEENKNPDKPTT